MARKANEPEMSGPAFSIGKCIFLMVLGGFLVIKGSDFAVSAASEIARLFGISERFIGLTIVALGTSLPELVTSVMAARKGNADLAVGNIVGSNIFNILFVVGTTALICNVSFDPKFLVDTGISVFAGVLLLLGALRHRRLGRVWGIVTLCCYGLYFIYLCA